MQEQRWLGELLVRRGVLSADRLEGLLDVQKERGTELRELVVTQQVADDASIARALAAESGLEFVDRIDVAAIPTAPATRLPITYAKTRRILVMDEGETQVRAVVSDPLDVSAVDDVRALFGKPVDIVVTSTEILLDAINRVYERGDQGAGELQTKQEGVDEDELVDILDSDDEAPIIRWVNGLFFQAVKERASDIHIEPEEREVVVRYRIDGELYVAKRANKQFMSSIVARIKIMSGLNIAEKRLPQDGRIGLKIAGNSIDVRVSTIPTSRGFERIVMRLLMKTNVLLDLTDLGFSARDFGLMNELIKRPDGIILVTGPTGSGKTTTLYACLNVINHPNLNILTAEDPVEYEIGGIHQVHVQPKIGLTFASALRAFLRQDPDVVMVGEIRDKETVDIAINASLTGHLVLSTIHTNDAAGAITRMVDMGVEPFLIRSSVIGILAQRLVRVLCPHCKEAGIASQFELSQLGIDAERTRQRRARKLSPKYVPQGVDYKPVGSEEGEEVHIFRAKGCDKCLGTGYQGRRGIYELLMMDDAVGPLVLKNADAQTIKRAAATQGMDSLRDDGARKVLLGLTSVEEVLAATQEDVVIELAMAVFEYTGITIATGKSVNGVRDAENPKALRAILRREGVMLSSATEDTGKQQKKKAGEIDVFAFMKRASTSDVAVMTRQLATLVRAGIPLVESIAALTEQLEKQDLKRIMTAVRERLNEGSSFSKALESHTRAFPPLYVNMVAAGEASGTLEAVLERLADYMNAQARLKGKVGAALAYPALMTLIGVALMSVMMIAVVPKVTSIFQSLDHPLPWYTQLLIFVSGFLASYWWLVLALGALGGWFFRRWVAKKEGRLKWDGFLLSVPIFGKLLQMLAIARFAKTLSTLLASGVPLLKAMEIVKNVLDNAALEKVIEEAAGSIREGETIADPLRRSKRFPPIVTHMIAVGERSGQLEQMLASVSDSYDAQVEVRVQALTSLLEPLIIVTMGGAVGFIAFAILMPLIQLNDFVQ